MSRLLKTLEPAVDEKHHVHFEHTLDDMFGAGDSHEAPHQLHLPWFARLDRSDPSLSSASSNSPDTVRVDEDPLGILYLRRLRARGVAPPGAKAYRYQLDAMLKIAARIRTSRVDLQGLMSNIALLGRVLVDDVAPSRPGIVSRWTLAQRRSAARSFASLVNPELTNLIGGDPLLRIEASLRLMAERVGTGYRLTGGRPRNRGGYVPSADEIDAVIHAAGQESGFRGIRNRVFLEILVTTGTRINALRLIDGTECFEMPSGRLRLFVHDKGKREPREVELTPQQSDSLKHYMDAFNQLAAGRRWKTRVDIGSPGPIWKNSSRGRWPYDTVVGMLGRACRDAGVTEFSPHALRRAFATDAGSHHPRHIVALAGGWQGLERLDDHYIRPRESGIRQKLYPEVECRFALEIESVSDAATLIR